MDPQITSFSGNSIDAEPRYYKSRSSITSQRSNQTTSAQGRSNSFRDGLTEIDQNYGWIDNIHYDIGTHVYSQISQCYLAGVNPNYVFAPGNSEKKILVSWEPACSPFVKVNTDGASKGNPGLSACGGVYRSPFGTFLGAFSLSLGIQTSYYAELMAVFQAADIAETERWSHLWIESDSKDVVNGIQKKHIDAPAQLKNRWNIFLQQMEFMKIKCSHILREGNKVADALANLGLKYQGLQLWDNPPEEIRKLLLDDACGHPNIRNS